VHIIGRHQVTTDLPEWLQDKHVPLDEYNGLTRDQRTRGMGGLITSCAEENLLQLESDRYHGPDICTHEFAHNIENFGIPPAVRALFDSQYEISKSKGLWINSYAGSNSDESTPSSLRRGWGAQIVSWAGACVEGAGQPPNNPTEVTIERVFELEVCDACLRCFRPY
jgi:hypothetical protein